MPNNNEKHAIYQLHTSPLSSLILTYWVWQEVFIPPQLLQITSYPLSWSRNLADLTLT